MSKLPILTKCCSYVPLRYGLMAYGTLQTALYLRTISSLIKDIPEMYSRCLSADASVILFILIVIDILLLGILFGACYKKKISLLQNLLVSFKIWWFLCLMFAIFVSIRVPFIYKEAIDSTDRQLLDSLVRGILVVLPCAICLRVYFIILINSFITKLVVQEQSSADDKEKQENDETIEFKTYEKNNDHMVEVNLKENI